MRAAFTIIYAILVFTLGICAIRAGKHSKPISKPVAVLLAALIPPVIGNQIIIWSGDQFLATIGCYVYYLGMDVVLAALLVFTLSYCKLKAKGRKVEYIVLILLGVDMIQLLCNPVFGHAFTTDPVMVEGRYYYTLVPLTGQAFHRLLDYGLFLSVILIFLQKTIRASRVDAERYAVILVTMIVTGLSQTFFIFSRTPVDRSMLLYGVFGLLVFYFSLYYRPLRLLDRMLASIASEMPEGLFFFDSTGQCIWANQPGAELAGLGEDQFDHAMERLELMFGDLQDRTGEWSEQRSTGEAEKLKSYVVERHTVLDTKGRDAGFFFRIRDNTDEQKLLQHETFKATHDSLTGVYNRSGYELIQDSVDIDSVLMLLIDADRFKSVNDNYGHEVGDQVLKRIADTITRHFREKDYVCRIGGDEFVILMMDAGLVQDSLVKAKIRAINQELAVPEGGLPPISISVGAEYGKNVADSTELYRHTDIALYETKRRGRCGVTMFFEMSV